MKGLIVKVMFICRYCEEEFNSSKELKNHEKVCDCNPVNTRVELFRCKHCRKTFYSKDELKRHRCTRQSDEEYDDEG